MLTKLRRGNGTEGLYPVSGHGQAIVGHGRSIRNGGFDRISCLSGAVNTPLTMFEHCSSVLSGHGVREGEAVTASSR